MNIGVFDSGRGGEFIADGLRKYLPNHHFIVVNDTAHVPYGSRTSEEIITLTTAAIQPLIAQGCAIIVIACNTATMAAITELRARYPAISFVGIEPMVKPAQALSKTHHITVLATPLTLKSDRYQYLIKQFGPELTIDQPNAAGWAAAIEHHQADDIAFSDVAQSIARGSDVIVLACTHYLVLKQRLRETFPGVTILEPTEAIARQIQRLITQ